MGSTSDILQTSDGDKSLGSVSESDLLAQVTCKSQLSGLLCGTNEDDDMSL